MTFGLDELKRGELPFRASSPPMRITNPTRAAIAQEVQDLLPVAARCYDEWRAKAGPDVVMSAAVKRRIALHVTRQGDPGFGIAERLLVMQSVAIAIAIYERFHIDSASFRAVANPDNHGDFSGETLVNSAVSAVTGGGEL